MRRVLRPCTWVLGRVNLHEQPRNAHVEKHVVQRTDFAAFDVPLRDQDVASRGLTHSRPRIGGTGGGSPLRQLTPQISPNPPPEHKRLVTPGNGIETTHSTPLLQKTSILSPIGLNALMKVTLETQSAVSVGMKSLHGAPADPVSERGGDVGASLCTTLGASIWFLLGKFNLGS